MGEYRNGPNWRIPLPKQCWKSGETEHLLDCTILADVRCFVSPVFTLVMTGLVAGTAFVLSQTIKGMQYNYIVFGTFALIGGNLLLFARSWTEQVSIGFWSKLEYANELRTPMMVLHENELYIFLPTKSIAEATQEAVKAKRREKGRYAEEMVESKARARAAVAPETPAGEEPLPGSISRRDHLPSIKLDE